MVKQVIMDAWIYDPKENEVQMDQYNPNFIKFAEEHYFFFLNEKGRYTQNRDKFLKHQITVTCEFMN